MIELTPIEARVIGVLMEKAITTPDQYPLSLNGLTTGCNQKTNREPVMNLSETEVQETLDSLAAKQLVSEVRIGGRVPKYKHRFSGTEFAEYKFNAQELGIICTLFLRGPQTPGELRTRTNRLCNFSDVQETENVLNALTEKAGGPFVHKLPKEAGRRESRYMHLFSGDAPPESAPAEIITSTPENSENQNALQERIELLESVVEELEGRIATLEGIVEQLTG